MFLSEFIWNKPVLSFYRENNEQPEREAFAVIKAKETICFQIGKRLYSKAK